MGYLKLKGKSKINRGDFIELSKEDIEMLNNDTSAEYLLWAKTNEKAIVPTKRVEDAGYDLYACFEDDSLIVPPHETRLVGTGIASAFSPLFVMILKERGSTGTKGIGERCGVVDSGYRGEINAVITNHNSKPLIITKETDETKLSKLAEEYVVYPYKKAIAQAVLLYKPELEEYEVGYDTLMKLESERGTGKLGSSGK